MKDARWLTIPEIAKFVDWREEEIESVLDKAPVPTAIFFGELKYRSLEVCSLFMIRGHCHTCLKPIKKGRYCSTQCESLAETLVDNCKTPLVIGLPPIQVLANEYLMGQISEVAQDLSFTVPEAVRYLICEGLNKYKRRPAL